MDVFVTYQQDTVEVKSLLHTLQKKDQPANLNIKRKSISILEIPERRPEPQKQEPVRKTYTPQQIRYWQLQQENKLLVNDSRYIRPRNEVAISTTQSLKDTGIVLPKREIRNTNTDWLTAFLFLGLIIFATIRYYFATYISHLFLSLINYSTTVRMFQEKNYPIFHAAYRLDILFYIVFSIFVYQVLNFLKWGNLNTNFSFFAIVLASVLVYFFTKKIIYLILGSTFEARSETSEFLFNMDNSNRTLGLILLPVITLIAFSPSQNPLFIVFLGLIIVFTFYAILIQRGILILLKKQFSILYLFLYFCTLEFLPLLLIYKVVVE